MSLIYLPPSHRALADTCSLRYNIDRPCEEPELTIKFTIFSTSNDVYTTYFGPLARAQGTPTSTVPISGTWTNTLGPLLIWGGLEETPDVNRYYDYVNHTGASIVVSAVTLFSNYPIGTNTSQNALNVAAGVGVSCCWEREVSALSATGDQANVTFGIQNGSYIDPLETTNGTNLIDYTGTWLTNSGNGLPVSGSTPEPTPINKKFLFTAPVTVPNNKRLRIQFWDPYGDIESVSMVCSKIDVTLHLL